MIERAIPSVGSRMVIAAALVATLAVLGGGCAGPGEIGSDSGEADAVTKGGALESTSHIHAQQVYVRYRPQGAAFDYFMQDDQVKVHYASSSGEYLCVSGRTRYGLDHTGWVAASSVTEHGARTGDQGRCKDYSDGHTKVSYPCCRLLAKAAFRYGPSPSAERIVDSVTPDGYLDGEVGRATNSTGDAPHADADGHAWVSRGCENDPGSPKTAPGRNGWVLASDLDCSGGSSGPDQTEPPSSDPGNSDPGAQTPGSDPGSSDPGGSSSPPAPSPQCYVRCCDAALYGPFAEPDAASCVAASQSACADADHVKHAELDGVTVYDRLTSCWAKCANRDAYHIVDGVTQDCTQEAKDYCSVSDRGAFQDAAWSQCEP